MYRESINRRYVFFPLHCSLAQDETFDLFPLPFRSSSRIRLKKKKKKKKIEEKKKKKNTERSMDTKGKDSRILYLLPFGILSRRSPWCWGYQHLFNNGERSDVHTRLPDKYQVYRSSRYSRPVSTG